MEKMMEKSTQRCLFCFRHNCIPSGNRNWYCTDCKVTFDPEDDGTPYRNGEKAAISKEEYRLRQIKRSFRQGTK